MSKALAFPVCVIAITSSVITHLFALSGYQLLNMIMKIVSVLLWMIVVFVLVLGEN